ncbi:hypothetical protein D9758_016739 [Tetrapyrgos nigripes]|uniref:GH18 domain-containing protein n=1 Tax=Tetrapyrgos nigripes TaxID=182062 RepID=A0A8H5FGT0_9AGAR|nr:hypothetical protein D9758_016739 [Tetrapyrgos nigripes]
MAESKVNHWLVQFCLAPETAGRIVVIGTSLGTVYPQDQTDNEFYDQDIPSSSESSALLLAPVSGRSSTDIGVVTRASSSTQKPIFLTYVDDSDDKPIPSVDQIKGFNVLALGFYTGIQGPMDSAAWWESQGDSKQKALKKAYTDAGIKLIVSIFGGSEEEMHITSKVNETAAAGLAKRVGDWVIKNNLDGVDVDFEDFDAMKDGTGVPWLVTFQKALRSALPSSSYVISHTPGAWLFANGKGQYVDVHKQVGDTIDWFYNAGPQEYTTCDSLLKESSSQFPQTALFEIMKSGIPQEKIVLGKPATKQNAGQGNMDASALAKCLATAKGSGWSGGVMGWEYPEANSAWITTVRSESWPVEEV